MFKLTPRTALKASLLAAVVIGNAECQQGGRHSSEVGWTDRQGVMRGEEGGMFDMFVAVDALHLGRLRKTKSFKTIVIDMQTVKQKLKLKDYRCKDNDKHTVEYYYNTENEKTTVTSIKTQKFFLCVSYMMTWHNTWVQKVNQFIELDDPKELREKIPQARIEVGLVLIGMMYSDSRSKEEEIPNMMDETEANREIIENYKAAEKAAAEKADSMKFS